MQKKSHKFNFLNKILIIITLLVMSITSVTAIGFTMADSITLGSNTQSRDTTAISTVSITNTDSVNTITNLNAAFTTSLSGYTNSNFNITMTGAPTQINPSNSTTVSIQGYVPNKFDSGNKQIGTMTITGVSAGTTISKTIPVYMDAQSNLEVKRVTVDVDGDEQRVSSDETIKVKRGQKITLTIEVKNTFSSSSDITINDVNVGLDSNEDIDLNEDETLGDISAGDEDETTFNFNIPNDASDGTETVTITVDGDDDNSATHKTTFTFKFDVQVKSYDLQINSITSPTGGFCQGQTGNLNIEIENVGTRDITQGFVYITSDDIQFSKKISDISITDGSRKTVTTQIPISSTTPIGTYVIRVQTNYQVSSSSFLDDETNYITVKNCAAIPTVTPTTTTQPKTNTTFEVVNQGNQPSQGQSTNGDAFGVPTYKKSITTDGIYIALLVLACIIVVLLIILIMRSGKAYY